MIAVFRQRDFGLLWLGGFVSLIGDQALAPAASFYVYRITGSVLQTGTLTILYFLPGVLFGSVAGVFADRWNVRRTIIAINLAQAVFLLPLLLVHLVTGIWILYAVVLSQSMLSLFMGPAIGVLLPLLVERERLPRANALGSISANASRLIGPPLGGMLLAFTGLSVVTLVDCARLAGWDDTSRPS